MSKRPVYLGPDRRVPMSRCVVCRQKLRASFSLELDQSTRTTPRPGDRTVCVYCGAWMAFDKHMRLRALTADELKEMATNEDVAIASRVVSCPNRREH